MKYSVKTLREAGLEAKWGKNSKGAPIIFARNPMATLAHQRNSWWAVNASMWKDMSSSGIIKAFDKYTILGEIFSIKE